MDKPEPGEGRVIRIAGPVVAAVGLDTLRLYDVVRVGDMGLVGEVIRLSEEQAVIQVYEDTSGLRVGEPVRATRASLVAQLGPGLLGSVYDGLQRPLTALARASGDFIERGVDSSPLAEDVLWEFTPFFKAGDRVAPGDVLGTLPENETVLHRVMVPAKVSGRLEYIGGGSFHHRDVVAVVEMERLGKHERCELTLSQTWPVRKARGYSLRLDPDQPLITGTRIIDAFFPVAKGGTAIIPGGFGTGKTVLEHSLACWADADVVIFVGCGERGNEMTEVLEDFPKLIDPRTQRPLMQRTVLIANTSNMPVAAREASIYLGITIAEYYRDMGYNVLLLADSTSRWGEALREISGRLEEMPGEEGYPAYLAARLAEFYERSGRVVCQGLDPSRSSEEPRIGSISVVGAISPQGGDFSEPVTQSSMRISGAFWGLDYELSRRRHFPAINWTRSYSLYHFSAWYRKYVAEEWGELTRQAMALLQKEVELLEIVQLVGPDALPEKERAVLFAAQMLREDFLQQSSYHPVDRFCPFEKSYWMLKAIMSFSAQIQAALERGAALPRLTSLPVVGELARMKEIPEEQAANRIQQILQTIQEGFRV